VAIGHLGGQPFAAWPPATERRHVGLGPGFVDEDQAGGVNPRLIGPPLRPPPSDIGTILLARENGFF
jgi:hypothetical protein